MLSVSLEKKLRITETSQRKLSYTKNDPNLESVSEFISFLSYTIIAPKGVKISINHSLIEETRYFFCIFYRFLKLHSQIWSFGFNNQKWDLRSSPAFISGWIPHTLFRKKIMVFGRGFWPFLRNFDLSQSNLIILRLKIQSISRLWVSLLHKPLRFFFSEKLLHSEKSSLI